MADLDMAVSRTIGLEGGFSHHPADTGGRTVWGISEKWFPEAWANGEPSTLDAMDIYRNHFWLPLRCNLLDSQNVANELFDTGVNCGIGKAAGWLQESLNDLCPGCLKVDGRIGPLTIEEANACGYERALFNMMNYRQAQHYMDIGGDSLDGRRAFLAGWFAHRIGGWVDYE